MYIGRGIIAGAAALLAFVGTAQSAAALDLKDVLRGTVEGYIQNKVNQNVYGGQYYNQYGNPYYSNYPGYSYDPTTTGSAGIMGRIAGALGYSNSYNNPYYVQPTTGGGLLNSLLGNTTNYPNYYGNGPLQYPYNNYSYGNANGFLGNILNSATGASANQGVVSGLLNYAADRYLNGSGNLYNNNYLNNYDPYQNYGGNYNFRY